MFAPIFCLSVFAVSAWASVELHGVLELPRAVQSLTESQRFKRQFGSDRATQCVSSCAQDLTNTFKSLDMEQSANGFLNSRLYEPDTFNSFCEGMAQWESCSGACSYSQTKTRLVKTFQPMESLCGEDREMFESHQACYAESDPQQNRVCDPKCGGQEELQGEMSKFMSAAQNVDLDQRVRILNKVCEMMSCQIDCRTPIIYATCKDKEAAFFFGRWAEKSTKPALAPLNGYNLDIQCDAVINFNPDKFQVNEDGVMVSLSGTSMIAKSAMHSLFLAVVSMVFAGLFV